MLEKSVPLTEKEKVLIFRARRIQWGLINVYVFDGRIIMIKPAKKTVNYDYPIRHAEVRQEDITGFGALTKNEREMIYNIRETNDNLIEILVKESRPVCGKIDLNGIDLLDTTGGA